MPAARWAHDKGPPGERTGALAIDGGYEPSPTDWVRKQVELKAPWWPKE